jgi:hypothetical protein
MLKKVLLVLVLVGMSASFALADFGVIIRGGSLAGSNNYNYFLYNTSVGHDEVIEPWDTDIKPSKGDAYPNKDLDDSNFSNVGIEVFSESPLGAKGVIGLRGGYVYYNKDTINNDFYYKEDNSYHSLLINEIRSEAYSIPVMVYYKYNATKLFSFSAGAGFSLLVNKWTERYNQTTYWRPNGEEEIPANDNTYTKINNKTLILINFGAEARLTQRFALILDLGYQGNGKTTYETVSFGTITRDFSGVFINIGAKIYAF